MGLVVTFQTKTRKRMFCILEACHSSVFQQLGRKGTILESGIRMMSAVTAFAIATNSFEGALPESGLQVMRA
eukprot:3170374-Amphidinium_carterae.1